MTPSQSRYLRYLLAYRDRPPTIGSMLRASGRSHVGLLVGFTALGVVTSPAFGWTGAAFLATSYFSVLLRDLSHFRASAEAWPAAREVIDWPKLEGLVAAMNAPPPPPP